MAIRSRRKAHSTLNKQRGAALILLAFIIGLSVTALMIKSFNVASIQAERNEDTMQALMRAKDAIIGWAVSYDTAPGQLPWPDRRETANPNYDGHSDCSTSNFNLINSQGEPNFLGQIPFLETTAPCNDYPGIGNLFQDSSSSNLWYAVSRNLVRNYSASEDPIINPGIIENPTYPWMIVRDAAGAIISSRVAVVIIAPGPPIGNQNRSGAAPLPVNFLDQVTINGSTYSNFDYDADSEDFIMGDTTTGAFNDKLVYITIDELMAGLEKRAANTAKAALIEYAATNGGNFPYAAPLGITRGYSCADSTNAGLLPLDDNGTCSYSFAVSAGTGAPSWWPNWLPWNPNNGFFSGVNEYSVSSICSFDDVERVVFTRTSGGDYNTPGSQNCAANGMSCTCTGAGSCSGANAPTFTCDAAGNCNSATHQRNMNSRVEFEGGYFSTASGVCSPAAPECETGKGYPVECAGANVNASGSMSRSCSEPALTGLPTWFKSNRWQDYFFYRTSRDEPQGLAAGSKDELKAILIGTGAPLNPSASGVNQSRPSCALQDYLDSDENAGGELLKFDANHIPKTADYNDKLFIIAP